MSCGIFDKDALSKRSNSMIWILGFKDSGGLNLGSDQKILADVNQRVFQYFDRADVIIFVVEYSGLTTLDEEIAKVLPSLPS